jgi:hypothetical protein
MSVVEQRREQLPRRDARFVQAGVEFHVPAWLITCNAVHSERLADGSTDLYGTVVIPVIESRLQGATR